VRQVWTSVLQEEKPARMTFYIRSAAGPDAVAAIVRRTIGEIDPALPVYRFKTVRTQINETHYVDRLISMLSAAFGILATLLAAVGLYGTIALAVARRTPELGVRMALGASRGKVLSLIMSEVLAITLIGIAVAVPLTLLLGRYLRDQLFQVQPTDAATIAVSVCTLLSVALVAGYIPAFRATRIDPVNALRWE
jgi:putative ABC transport system permease protein